MRTFDNTEIIEHSQNFRIYNTLFSMNYFRLEYHKFTTIKIYWGVNQEKNRTKERNGGFYVITMQFKEA